MGNKHNREPIKYTCPDIDSAISILEDLRSANDALRSWGTEEAEKVDELEKEIESLKEEIKSLEENNEQRD